MKIIACEGCCNFVTPITCTVHLHKITPITCTVHLHFHTSWGARARERQIDNHMLVIIISLSCHSQNLLQLHDFTYLTFYKI